MIFESLVAGGRSRSIVAEFPSLVVYKKACHPNSSSYPFSANGMNPHPIPLLCKERGLPLPERERVGVRVSPSGLNAYHQPIHPHHR